MLISTLSQLLVVTLAVSLVFRENFLAITL